MTDDTKPAASADDLERECADADRICAALGLTVEQSRTEGGSLNVPRIVAHINETLTALRESHAFGVAMSDRYIASQAAERALAALREQLATAKADRNTYDAAHKRQAVATLQANERAERAESALAAATEREEGLRRALQKLIGMLEIAAVMPDAIYKHMRVNWDDPALVEARAALAAKGAPDE